MKRIAIVGQPGSGKSTLALQLAARTGLPVFHMDHIHWKAGWQERDRDEKLALARDILRRDTWIFEGGFSKINADRLERADLLIWLDLPFGLRAWRVLKRTTYWFGRMRPDMQRDCREGLNPEMLRFFRYIWNTRRSGREKIATSLSRARPDLRVIHLKSPQQVYDFLAEFTN